MLDAAQRRKLRRMGQLEREKRSALRATIIPWGHPSTLRPPPSEGFGKPLSLIAMLPTPAGVRRVRIPEPDRLDGAACEARRQGYGDLHDDGGAATS